MTQPMGTRPTVIHVENGVPGINAPDPASYREFWAYYLSQHLHPMTRKVHAAATAAAILTGVTAILRRRWKVVAASPLVAYGPAFASHWIWEKNNPVVLNKGKPGWAAMADLEMVYKVFTGVIGQDVVDVRAWLGLEPHQVTLADRDRTAELAPSPIAAA
jgi:hypothetical protein